MTKEEMELLKPIIRDAPKWDYEYFPKDEAAKAVDKMNQ
jgi:hypothetical protein